MVKDVELTAIVKNPASLKILGKKTVDMARELIEQRALEGVVRDLVRDGELTIEVEAVLEVALDRVTKSRAT